MKHPGTIGAWTAVTLIGALAVLALILALLGPRVSSASPAASPPDEVSRGLVQAALGAAR